MNYIYLFFDDLFDAVNIFTQSIAETSIRKNNVAEVFLSPEEMSLKYVLSVMHHVALLSLIRRVREGVNNIRIIKKSGYVRKVLTLPRTAKPYTQKNNNFFDKHFKRFRMN